MKRIHQIENFTRKKKYLVGFRATYDEDGLYTNHNCEFCSEERFAEAYRAGVACDPNFHWHSRWRVYTACWLAGLALRVEGDFVECGTNYGLTSRTIIDYHHFEAEKDRQFYLIDTFKGIEEEQLGREEERNVEVLRSMYSDCYDQVLRNFEPFPNVHCVRGLIPGILPEVKTEKVAFLHIDLNCATPEIEAGNYFWPKLSPGGVCLLDDYAYPRFEEQKRAWDRFAEEKNISIYSSPTGQGIIIK